MDDAGPWMVSFKHKPSDKVTAVNRGTSWMDIKGITSASTTKTAHIVDYFESTK